MMEKLKSRVQRFRAQFAFRRMLRPRNLGVMSVTGFSVLSPVMEAAGCISEYDLHECQPIQVFDNSSRGMCYDLPYPHEVRVVVWCDGQSHPHGPTPYVSKWTGFGGLGIWVNEGYDEPWKCNWPYNEVVDRYYEFAH